VKDKKAIILVILAIGAIISLSHGMLSLSSRSRRARPAARPAAEASGETAQGSGVESIRRRVVRTIFKSSPRNPFSTAKASSGGAPFVLGGIVGSAKNPKAMIGNDIVGVGEKVGGCTVVVIKSDRVILNDGTRDIELKMEE
jgi:hypothetical protein